MKITCKESFICSLAFLFIVISSPLYSQQSKDTTDYPQGISRTLNDASRIDSLRKLLSHQQWDSVKRIYFDETYDPQLPDLVCYVDNGNNVAMGLVKGKKEEQELWGERKIWVLIFSDKDLNDIDESLENADKKGKDSVAFKVERDVLAYEPEPNVTILSGILQLVAGKIVETDIRKVATSDTSERLKLKKYKGGKDSIYVGMVGFPLVLDSKNRIVIWPTKDNLGFQFVNYNFGNFESSWFGMSLGVGFKARQFTLSNGKLHTLGLPDADVLQFDLFGNLYLSRPRLPVNSSSLAITFGTNLLPGTILRSAILGLRGGYGGGGLILGVNWGAGSDNVRRIGLFVGLDYML